MDRNTQHEVGITPAQLSAGLDEMYAQLLRVGLDAYHARQAGIPFHVAATDGENYPHLRRFHLGATDLLQMPLPAELVPWLERLMRSPVPPVAAELQNLIARLAINPATPALERAFVEFLPLSMRLLNEAHRRLMRGVRGATKQPGEVRRSQNWIGGTRPGNAVFVPSPPEELPALLTDLEKYLHAENDLPALVRIGLAHVQFETIHPYLDGNGRIGRLLITLLIEHWKLLSAPLLYLSLFFKRHRAEYYRLLGEVRRTGDWEAWTDFFLEGVATIADEAVAAAREMFALVSADRERLLAAPGASIMAIRLIEQLPVHPVVTIPGVVKLLKTTKPTAGKAVQLLESLGVLTETSGKQRDRTFAYTAYLEKLRAGTELEGM